MRRFVCIVALLAGFTRQDYVWSARPRPVTPVERPLADDPTHPLTAWWLIR